MDDSEPRRLLHSGSNQGEVTGFQVLLDSLHPRSTRVSWWSHPVHQEGAVKIFLGWDLFRLPFTQCGRIVRNAMLGQQLKGVGGCLVVRLTSPISTACGDGDS